MAAGPGVGQPPAGGGSYARLPGDSMLRPFKIDVLRVEDGLIAEVTTFHGRLHTAFQTPEVLT